MVWSKVIFLFYQCMASKLPYLQPEECIEEIMDWRSHTVGALEMLGSSALFMSELHPKELNIFVNIITHRFLSWMLGIIDHILYFTVGSQKWVLQEHCNHLHQFCFFSFLFILFSSLLLSFLFLSLSLPSLPLSFPFLLFSSHVIWMFSVHLYCPSVRKNFRVFSRHYFMASNKLFPWLFHPSVTILLAWDRLNALISSSNSGYPCLFYPFVNLGSNQKLGDAFLRDSITRIQYPR